MYNPQLETFIKVADAGSFSKAANDLFISTTAVIKQINLLEANLELQLFIRTHRGLTLTESGQSLYRDAKYIIGYAGESVRRAKEAMRKTDQTVRIGTSPMTPGQFLVELWPQIYRYLPEVKFQLVPFENTPENAVEILRNLGRNIDLVAGIYDNAFLAERECAALELSMEPICVAVSVHHRLASKDSLGMEDLYGENLMLIRRKWNSHVDKLRDDILQDHPQIHVVDFDFYNVSVFNQCENSNDLLMTIPEWAAVHPLLKILPVEWTYTIPFGLMHAPTPSKHVRALLQTVQRILQKSDASEQEGNKRIR